MRAAASAVATVCVGLVPLACGLPLGGLGAVDQHGVEGVNQDDAGTVGAGEGGPSTGDDAVDPPGDDGGDVEAGGDASVGPDGGRSDDGGADAPDHDARVGDASDAGKEAGDAGGGDASRDTGGADGTTPDAEAGADGGSADAEAGAPPGPTFVQVNSVTPQMPQSSFSVDYKMPQSAGDLNVVVVGRNDTVALVLSVSDSAGNAYALAVGPTRAPSFSQSIFYANNIAATAGKNTVTVQLDAPVNFGDIRILEYSGLATDSPLDMAVGSAGTGSTSSAGPIVTTGSDLLVAANTVEASTLAPDPTFAERILTNPNSDIVEDRVVSLPGSYTASASISPSTQWVMQLVAFRAK